MSVVSRINNFHTTIGGEAHSGWLPPDAALPLPTPRRDVVLNFVIECEGSGYLLIVNSADDSVRGDTWHQSVADAQELAESWYGVSPTAWSPVEPTAQ
jgi:hypothetical protein